MNKNQAAMRVDSLADKIAFTPSMTAVQLIDEFAELAKEYPNDYNFGLIVRSTIHKTHQNLKS